MIGRIAVSLACFLLGALVAPNPSRAVPLPVLTAGSDTVNVGDVFTIPISIANVVALTSFQFDLAFDPTIITALSFTDIGTEFRYGGYRRRRLSDRHHRLYRQHYGPFERRRRLYEWSRHR